MEARREAIVTGDKHLLRLGNYKGAAIMRVTDFLMRLLGPEVCYTHLGRAQATHVSARRVSPDSP
jgi:hypothetical protein